MSSEVIHHVTWHMALVPCVTLAWLQLAGQPRDVAWWWLGGAFLVSWLADAAAYSAIDPWLVSLVYPMTQAGIIPVTTNVILCEFQRTWNRPDAAQWGTIYQQLVPHYKAVAESYQRAQEAAKKSN